MVTFPLDLFLLILVHIHTNVFVQFYPCFLAFVEEYLGAHSIVYFLCSVLSSVGHADIMWSTVSSNFWKSLHLLSVSVLSMFVA